MKSIIVSCWGTHGDVYPFIKLALHLKDKGYKIIFCSHGLYENLEVCRDFHYVALDSPEISKKILEDMGDMINPVDNPEGFWKFRQTYQNNEIITSEIQSILPHIDETTVCAIGRFWSSQALMIAAEIKNIPFVQVFLAPAYIISIPIFESFFGERLRVEINNLRKDFGLKPIVSWSGYMCASPSLGFWPHWYALNTSLWSIKPVMPGFAEHTQFKVISDNLIDNNIMIEKYIENHKQFAVITGGSSKAIQNDFYNISIRGCQEAKLPAIVITPYKNLISVNFDESFLYVPWADLPALLNRASVVIHHGGIGTIQDCIKFDCPQLIIPSGADRPDNSGRIQELGIGCFVTPKEAVPHKIANEILLLVDNETVLEKISSYKEEIKQSSFGNKVIEYIEDLENDKINNRNIFEKPDILAKIKHGAQRTVYSILKPPPPEAAAIDPTNICNLQCPLCVSKNQDYPKTSMPFELFAEILDKMDFLKTISLFNWGESLLNKDICRMIAEAASRKINVVLHTNLNVKCTEEFCEELLKSGLLELTLSIDGITQESYESYRKRGDLTLVMKNLRVLIDTKKRLGFSSPRIIWKYLVHSQTEKEMDQAKKIANDIGVPIVFTNFGIGEELPDFQFAESVEERMKSWLPENGKYIDENLKTGKEMLPKFKKICDQLFNYVVINPDGKISPCCWVSSKNSTFGDLKEQNFLDIWHNENYQYARSLFVKESYKGKKKDVICEQCQVFAKYGYEKSRTNIILSTKGSDGDINPFVKLGKYLKKEGYNVTLITHYKYKTKAENAGLQFLESEPKELYDQMNEEMIRSSDMVGNIDKIKKFHAKFTTDAKTEFEINQIKKAASTQRTIIIGQNGFSDNALLAAEILKYEYYALVLSPVFIQRMLLQEEYYGDCLIDPINKVRIKHGLNSVSSWYQWISSVNNIYGLYPSWFVDSGVHGQLNIKNVGFPLPEHSEEIDDNFLIEQINGAVCITPGTGEFIPDNFFEVTINGARAGGLKIVVVTKHKEIQRNYPDVFFLEYLNFERYFKYFSVIIHHGGIGTTYGALYAGVPQLILPQHFDQPYNALQMKKSGAGDFVSKKEWNAKSIAEKISVLTNKETKKTARKLSEQLLEQNPFDAILNGIESSSSNPDSKIKNISSRFEGDESGKKALLMKVLKSRKQLQEVH